MIKEKLLDKNYYLSKYSMFMRESFGMSENIDILLDWMKGIDSASEYITNVLDIWNENYKSDMEDKFGVMYYQRAKDETPFDLRGEYIIDDNLIRINNESIEIYDEGYVNPDDVPDEVYNTIFSDKKNKKEYNPHIYAAKKITDPNAQFNSNISYYIAETSKTGDDFVFIKRESNPKIEKLWEKDSFGRYAESEDEQYYSNKQYYKFDENLQKYILVSPYSLGLYYGNYCYFEYSNNEYIQISPKYLYLYEYNASTSSYIGSSDTSFNASEDYYLLTYIYNSDTNTSELNYIKANPKNVTMPLYELVDDEYVATEDEEFISGKDYYINYNFKYGYNSSTNLTSIQKSSPSYKYHSPAESEQGDGVPFEMLDVIASIVGCSRYNNIIIEDKIINLPALSNEDLLDLIKIKIIQNNYKGTAKEIIDLYKEKMNYNIYFMLEDNSVQEHSHLPGYESACCRVYLEDIMTDEEGNSYYISDNIKKLFKYSDLFIQSVGITYHKYCISDIGNILTLDTNYMYVNEKAIYTEEEASTANLRTSSIKLG